MKQFFVKSIIGLTLLMLVMGVGGWCLLAGLLPQYYFPLYALLPAFFWLFYMLYVGLLYWVLTRLNDSKLYRYYLAMKVLKVIDGLFFIVCYALIVKTQMPSFLFTFLAYYLVTLILESLFVVILESRLKQVKLSIQENEKN